MKNPSLSLPGRRSAKAWAMGLVAVLAVALSGCADAPGAVSGSVVRVIDGDTLVIDFDAQEQTVRLLNVDTPETKHPDKPVECLGLEATAYLEETLPPGTTVGLDFDVERLDQYDRTLAAVFTADGTLVNAEIARQGLGAAVLFEPNDKYYGAVQDAQAEAGDLQRGFYDAGQECTVPAAVDRAVSGLSVAMEAPVGATSGSAAAAATALVAALATAESLEAAFTSEKNAVRWVAISSAQATELSGDLAAAIASGKERLGSVQAEGDRLSAAEQKAAQQKAEAKAKAKADRERKASEAKAEKERKAAEAAERERLENLPPYDGPEYGPFVPQVPPQPGAPVQPPAVPPAAPQPPPAAPPQEVQKTYPGYNGPRCYAPGGETWEPCP